LIFATFSLLFLPQEYNAFVGVDDSITALNFVNGVVIGIIIFVSGFFALMLFLASCYRLVQAATSRVLARRLPIPAVSIVLMQILADVNQDPRRWNDPLFKQQAIGRLDRAADIIEFNIGNQLAGAASASESIVRESFRQIGGGLRNKIMWLITPKENTRQDFVATLQDILINLVLGQWDALERADPTKERGPSPIKRILSGGRHLLLAFDRVPGRGVAGGGHRRFSGRVGL
jgi:hypothetical protein